MKLCKDCKWFREKITMDHEFCRCANPRFLEGAGLVLGGEHHNALPYCSILRKDNWLLNLLKVNCGSKARGFEPK